MALEFVGDAISLSGITGSKLKSQIIGEYYPFWWNITSGGESRNHEWPTTIVELDAATGEIYIKDTNETLLGSSGHALSLKCDGNNTGKLKVVLVEKDESCYYHLKKVIKRRWPRLDISSAESSPYYNRSNVYLLNVELDDAITKISQLRMGNSLFFFDPLRGVPFEKIEKVAKSRIKEFYKTGIEFIVFVFTSDWFLGRDELVGLPETIMENEWSYGENLTVLEVDDFFGDKNWRSKLLNNKPIDEREKEFIELYKTRLHKWFRYVLPMPFNPKNNQLFHLILCSNYETGVRATREFFCDKAHNTNYKPDNKQAHARFRERHKDLYFGLKASQKPQQWKILWKAITQHEEGLCDYFCSDFKEMEPDLNQRKKEIKWLAEKGYLSSFTYENPWGENIIKFKVDWRVVSNNLGIDPPNELEPLSLRKSSLKEINK